MASRKLDDLYPPLKQIIEKALKIAEERNLPITITCTSRTPGEQKALYSQGRNSIVHTNSLRIKEKMPPITSLENRRRVTWTLSSYHNTLPKSMAVDFAVGKKKIYWDLKADVNSNEIPDYKEFANICKSVGGSDIEWGGDWNKQDNPHIQWKGGKEIDQSTPLEPVVIPPIDPIIDEPPVEPIPPPIDPIIDEPPVEPIPPPVRLINEDKPKKKFPIINFIFNIISKYKKGKGD